MTATPTVHFTANGALADGSTVSDLLGTTQTFNLSFSNTGDATGIWMYQDPDTGATQVMVTGFRKSAAMGAPPPPPPPPPPAPVMAVGSAEALEATALRNPFIQTPPLQRLDARACVVYSLN